MYYCVCGGLFLVCFCLLLVLFDGLIDFLFGCWLYCLVLVLLFPFALLSCLVCMFPD